MSVQSVQHSLKCTSIMPELPIDVFSIHQVDIWCDASVAMDHGCVLLYLTMDPKSDSQEKVIIYIIIFLQHCYDFMCMSSVHHN